MIATEIKERPILFSGEMVRAILEGRKTQTRRVIKPQPVDHAITEVKLVHPSKHPKNYFDSYCNERKTEANPRGKSKYWCWWTRDDRQCVTWGEYICPYGKPGDRLWVRETFGISHRGDSTPAGKPYDPITLFRATDSEPEGYEAGVQWEKFRWRPSIHMPRWASRILLEITDVRVERVQDISEEDVLKEIDIERYELESSPVITFRQIWDSINKSRGFGWGANPWVWVVEFKQVEASK